MCGRYVSPDEASIEREFNLVRQVQDIAPCFNVAPTQMVPVLRTVDGTRKLDTLRWGLIPFFAKGEPPKCPQPGLSQSHDSRRPCAACATAAAARKWKPPYSSPSPPSNNRRDPLYCVSSAVFEAIAAGYGELRNKAA